MMIRIIVGLVLGGGIGFLIGHFGRCSTGVCPMTNNPYISTIVGAIWGLVIALIMGK